MRLGVAKCVWQNGMTKSALGEAKPRRTHLCAPSVSLGVCPIPSQPQGPKLSMLPPGPT